MKNRDKTEMISKKMGAKTNMRLNNALKNTLVKHRGKLGVAAGIAAASIFVSIRELNSLNGPQISQLDPELDSVTEEAIPGDAGVFVSVDTENLVHYPAENLSFSDAFSESRELLGAGGVFNFNGKYYNTYFKEEWDSMQEEERLEYFAGIEGLIDTAEARLVQSEGGKLVQAELTDENILKITFDDPSDTLLFDRIEIDINGDGNADLAFNIEHIIKEPSTVDQYLNQESFLIGETSLEDFDHTFDSEMSEFVLSDEDVEVLHDHAAIDRDVVDLERIEETRPGNPEIEEYDEDGDNSDIPDTDDDFGLSSF